MRWWLAVLVAVGLSLGAALAEVFFGSPWHPLFLAVYAAGCLVAVIAVRGPALPAVAVLPPVLLVLAVGLGVLARGGGRAALVTAGVGVVVDFPVMCAVTATTVLIGSIRVVRRRSGRGTAPAGEVPPPPAT